MSRRKRKPIKRLIIQSESSEDDDDDDFAPATKKFIKSEKPSTNEKRLKRLISVDDENTLAQNNSTCSTATDNSLTDKDSPIKKDTDTSSLITDKKGPNQAPLPKKQQEQLPLVTIPPNKDSRTKQNKPLPQSKPYWKPPGAANGSSSTCSSSPSLGRVGPCVRVGLSRKANIKPLHSLK